jgi:acid phosphatase
MENHTLAQMKSGMPKTYALAQKYGYATGYDATTHPSLPNYIAIASGHTHGVDNDNSPAAWPLAGHTVFSRAVRAGEDARVYAQSMPGRCTLGNSGDYAVRHNPWAYFVSDRSNCDRFDQPFGAFAPDVSAGTLPNAGLVVPDLMHDAHDGTLGQADTWFATQMQKVFAGPDWASGHLAVVLTADEDDRNNGNRVLTVVIHPSQHGNVVAASLNHYALFELYEDVLGLPHERSYVQSPSMARAFGLPLS